MKSLAIAFTLAASLVLASCSTETANKASDTETTAPITQSEAEAIFDYAYPLVIMRISQDVMFTVPFRPKSVPNQFIHFTELAKPEQRAVVLGNRNTLYSVGWLDLSAGPVLFEIPDMGDRYYVMPLLDAWTNTFASLGSRTTGQGEQKYLISNASWRGDVPDGYEHITSPTNMVWITGRIQADSAEDAQLAAAQQANFKLTTATERSTGENPFANYKPRFKALEVRKPVPYSLKMKPKAFYDTFFAMWPSNPSPAADADMLDLLTKAGIKPETELRFDELSQPVRDQLEAGLEAKQTAYTEAFYKGTEQTTPWIFNLDPNMGDWGTDFARRAYWAMWGLGTNISKDAVYGVTQLDKDLVALNGANTYRLHFPAGGTPPTSAFWSVTNYDEDGYLERNDMDRYSLGSNHALTFEADGSLNVYLSHERPNSEGVNWVPAPEGNFKTLLRIYWPDPVVLEGGWSLPDVERLAKH